MFYATYCLDGPIKLIQSTVEVPQRISSHLATIVSRALRPQDGRIPCPVDRNLKRQLQIKSVSEKKSRGHRTSKIVKSKQSYSNGHLPYHCSF